MRPAERNINPLDLNNLPDDHSMQQLFHDDISSSATGGRRKKSGDGKVYECRFCSLKFWKSQALGGHMNRHRQERETETLNRARQLVFNNDTHLNCQAVTGGGDKYGTLYPPRLFPPQAVAPPPYYVGHVLGTANQYGGGTAESNYTCIGAPVGHAEEGFKWGRQRQVPQPW